VRCVIFYKHDLPVAVAHLSTFELNIKMPVREHEYTISEDLNLPH
jgi:hypothetical protein